VETFADTEEDLRMSMRRVRTSPFIPFTDSVRGFIYDVTTGRLNEVQP
jgi:carbonic anhydrase